ncbi:MAG: hypothetical protein R3B82_28225, partial [Sandaracinaceae bacterium]
GYKGPERLLPHLEALPVDAMAHGLARTLLRAVDGASGQKWSSGDLKLLALVAACYDDEAIAAWLAGQGHVKNLVAVVNEYFTLHPERRAALSRVAEGKGKPAEAAATILASVARTVAAPAKKAAREEAKVAASVAASVVRSPALGPAKRPVLDVSLPAPPESIEGAEHAAAVRPHSGRTAASSAGALARALETGFTPPFGALTDEDALAWLERSAGRRRKVHPKALEGLAARVGPAATPGVIGIAVEAPKDHASLLLKARSPRVALPLAALTRDRAWGPEARLRLIEDIELLAPPLLAAAFGRAPKLRDVADLGLDVLRRHARVPLLEVADALGAEVGTEVGTKGVTEVGDATRALFAAWDADPPWVPAKGKPSGAVALDALPDLALVGGGVMGPDDREALMALLRAAPPDVRHPALDAVRDACTEASRDAFVGALFDAWWLAGAKAKDEHALHALGHLGGDASARRLHASLGRLVDKKVVLLHQSLEALTLFDTDLALLRAGWGPLALRGHADASGARSYACRSTGARDRAQALEDAIVPRSSSARQRPKLDYGARSFPDRLRRAPRRRHVVERLGSGLRRPRGAEGRRDARSRERGPAPLRAPRRGRDRVARTQIVRLERALRDGRERRAGDFEREPARRTPRCGSGGPPVWQVTDGVRGHRRPRVPRRRRAASFAAAWTIASGSPTRSIPPIARRSRSWASASRISEILQPFPQIGEVAGLGRLRQASWALVPYAAVLR